MKTASVTFTLNKELTDAYLQNLSDRRAGCTPEDKAWFDAMIKRAEALNPDREDLTGFLMFRAGFCAQWGKDGFCEFKA